MATTELVVRRESVADIPTTMKAAVFVRPGVIELQERPVPRGG